MSAIDDVIGALSGVLTAQGIDILSLPPDDLVAHLDMETVEAMLAPIIADEERAKFNRFNDLFPDEGPLRRELYPRHIEFFEAGATFRERLFMAGNRVGKAQPNDEPVLTPSGWRPMGDLRVGDFVIGSNGQATRIVGVYPQGQRPIVTLRASDGATTRCDLDHLWHVRPVKDGRLSPYQTLKAAELLQCLARGERWMLPERPSVTFADRTELPVDPYLVGLLLGDGGLSTDRVLLSTADAEMVEYAAEQAKQWSCDLRQVGSCTWHFATTVKRGGRHHNFLREALLGIGMIGHTSHSKRIPTDYLVSSEEDRLSLLQGLMDTDGSCGRSNGARSFYSVNRLLCEDVAGLARSLGMNATISAKNGRYKGEHHGSWKVHIAASEHSIFRLQRKAEQQRFASVKMRGVMVESIELAGHAECTCIEVEAVDHLYITRDFLVTHNTVAGGYEMTGHLTGQYPHWWPGRVFKRPIRAWAAGDTNETTRDIIQRELLGEVITGDDGRKTLDGSGLIPRDCIGRPKWKQGVQDFVDTVPVLHKTGGWSMLGFKSFDQKRRSFQGTAKDVIWLDEECPVDVYGECLMRVATTRGIIMGTFTPLMGLTEQVLQFLPKTMRPGEA